jgi:aquaporin Z
MAANWRRYTAELLGTMVLVFGGTTAVVASIRADAPVLVVVPFAFGLALLAGLYAFGEVSGGHFKPGRLARVVPRPPAGDE